MILLIDCEGIFQYDKNMNIPIVKEYGSWAVFIFSCAAGIITGYLTKPWLTGREFSVEILLTVLGLAFLINSKNPLTLFLRAREQKKEHLLWFIFFSLTGVILLAPFLREGIKNFLFFSPLIISYIILLLRGKEHLLITELNGFALLTLAAPISHFVITGEMSIRLFLCVYIFFAAGVFKVRTRLKKNLTYRVLMILYCAVSLGLFYLLNISPFILLPLIENIISVIWMKEEKLRTTGNTELIKGVVFTALLAFFWLN